jgi:hypothetical protein
MKRTLHILSFALPGILLAQMALAEGEALAVSGGLNEPPVGSRAGQLRLKFQLQTATSGGTLAASIDHNQQEWKLLSPDQRELFRKQAVAFLDKNPGEQEKLMKHYSDFLALSKDKREEYRRRSEWLKVVVASFSEEEKAHLEKMLPADRAKMLITRRDEMVRAGKLKLDSPATQPASTQPAAPAPPARPVEK